MRKKIYHTTGLYVDRDVCQLSPDKRMSRDEFRQWYFGTQPDRKRDNVKEIKINR